MVRELPAPVVKWHYRVTYKPAGYWPRRFVVHSLEREPHGHTEWLRAINSMTDTPLYLCARDVTEIVPVPA